MDPQLKSLLEKSKVEIKSLRASNERMSIRLNMFDQCMQLLHAQLPSRGMAESPDVCYDIEQYIKNQTGPQTDQKQ